MNTSLVNLNNIGIYVCDFVCNKHTFEIYIIVFALYPLTHNGYYTVHAFLRKLLHKKIFKFFWGLSIFLELCMLNFIMKFKKKCLYA